MHSRRYVRAGMSEEDAFLNTVECITGPINKIISTKGIKAVYESLSAADKVTFMQARCVEKTVRFGLFFFFFFFFFAVASALQPARWSQRAGPSP